MDKPVIADIARLRGMSVAELRDEWFRLYGEPTRSRNRDYLWKRLAWRVQELRHGGLSDAARSRIDEMAPDGFIRARAGSTPTMGKCRPHGMTASRHKYANPPPSA